MWRITSALDTTTDAAVPFKAAESLTGFHQLDFISGEVTSCSQILIGRQWMKGLKGLVFLHNVSFMLGPFLRVSSPLGVIEVKCGGFWDAARSSSDFGSKKSFSFI